jgi:PKD repeat protein
LGSCHWSFQSSICENSACLSWSIKNSNNVEVYSAQGVNQIDYVFTTSGTYQVCFTECISSNGNTTAPVTTCSSISVASCGCEAAANFTATYTGNCCYQLVDPTQTGSSCSKWIVFDPFGNETYFDGPVFTLCMQYSGDYIVYLVDCCEINGVVQTFNTHQTLHCDQCTPLAEFTYTDQGDCHYTFQDLTPAPFISEGCPQWEFVNNQNVVIGYAFGNTANFTFPANGIYLVRYTDCCPNSNGTWNSVTTTQTITTMCTCSTSAEFSITENNNCQFVFQDLTIGEGTCQKWTVYDANNNITAVGTGPNFTFQSSPGVDYKICMSDCCVMPNGTVFSDTKCAYFKCSICVPDAQFTYTNNDCTYYFTDTSPSAGANGNLLTCQSWTITNNQGNIVGSGSGKEMNFTFASSGEYTVCFNDCCMNANGSFSYAEHCQKINVVCISCEFTASLTATSLSNCQFQFTTNNSNLDSGCGLTYQWNFGDGGSSSQPNPTHTYSSSGSYNACVVITNTCGTKVCTRTVCAVVSVDCPVDISYCQRVVNSTVVNDAANDRVKSIETTPDGGYVVCGTVNESYATCPGSSTACSTNESDIYVAKFDANGSMIFTTIIGEGSNASLFYNEGATSILVRADGYYVMGNMLVSNASNTWDRDIYVAKLNVSGQKVWGHRYGYSTGGVDSREVAASFVDMSIAGGEQALLITGYSNRGLPNVSNPNYDFLAVKINPSTGAVIDNVNYPGRRAYFYNPLNTDNAASNTGFEKCYDAARIETVNGPEYILVGEHLTNTSDKNIFIVRIDQNLMPVSSLLIDNSKANNVFSEYASSIAVANNAVIIGGSITNSSNENAYLIHLNNAFSLVQSKTFGNTNSNERINEVRLMNNGKVVLVGRTGMINSGGDGFVAAYDLVTQSLSWINSTNRSGYDEELFDIARDYTAVGYYDVMPFTNNNSDLDQDREIFITKINDYDGKSCCLSTIIFAEGTAYNASSGVGKRSVSISTFAFGNVGGTLGTNNICLPNNNQRSFTDFSGDNELVIFPNPNSGSFNIWVEGNKTIESIRIVDPRGNLVKGQTEISTNDEYTELSLTQVADGMYYVIVQTAETTYTKRIIILH